MALELLLLPQKSSSGWGRCPQAPSVISLSCIRLFSSGPKLDNFCARNIDLRFTRALSLLAKPLLHFRSHSLLQTDFLSGYTGCIRNELINVAGLCVSFFKDEYKIVAVKYQFLCAEVQFILVLPHFRLMPPQFVCFCDGIDTQ